MSAGGKVHTGGEEASDSQTTFTVRIVENHSRSSRKLADAEIHFFRGELDGLQLTGFAVWVERAGTGESVTFSSRQFSVTGEPASFSMLRWIAKRGAQERMADVVVRAYRRYRRRAVKSESK
jgi:hypothetical protein